MSLEKEKLFKFLAEVQLEQYFQVVVEKLHVTRISHFDHVEDSDLFDIGMVKPEQRRLFEHLKKVKKKNFFGKFKKSFRRDVEKNNKSVLSNDQKTMSFDNGVLLPVSSSSMAMESRNHIRQGLRCLIQEKDIVLTDFLGKGAFGFVRKGEWTTQKGEKVEVAVKCLKSGQDKASLHMQTEFIKEANAMSSLDHPNLVRLYGIVLTTPMMLVTELAPLGSLLGKLRNEPEKFLISTLCSFVVQIVSGMKYLENSRFIHRDLAARNILLTSYEKIKIGDFGLMRALPTEMEYYIMQPNGLVPFAWCATECLKYRKFSHASDVWAFGVTVIEIFSYGEEPWPGLNGSQILEKIDEPNFLRPERPNHCPTEIFHIIRNYCWCHTADERAAFSTLEKLILQVLPKETTAPCSYIAQASNELSFEAGDNVTIIESRSDTTCVLAQTRKNGHVGYIPVRIFGYSQEASAGTSPPKIVPDSRIFGKELKDISPPLAGSFIHNAQSMGRNVAEDGRSPPSESGGSELSRARSLRISQTPSRSNCAECDRLSLVSRSSSSSSGSDFSTTCSFYRGSMKPGLPTIPQDIPKRTRGSESSGIGSSVPSCTSSFKEDFDPSARDVQKASCSSEYSSYDDRPMLHRCSRDNSMSDTSRDGTDCISSKSNLYSDQYENMYPYSYAAEFYSYSVPIPIPSSGQQRHNNDNCSPVRHGQNKDSSSSSVHSNHGTGCCSCSGHAYEKPNMTTLPIPVLTSQKVHYEKDGIASSPESYDGLKLSNSAPTTKFELKFARRTARNSRDNPQDNKPLNMKLGENSTQSLQRADWSISNASYSMAKNEGYEAVDGHCYFNSNTAGNYEVSSENEGAALEENNISYDHLNVNGSQDQPNYENVDIQKTKPKHRVPSELPSDENTLLQNEKPLYENVGLATGEAAATPPKPRPVPPPPVPPKTFRKTRNALRPDKFPHNTCGNHTPIAPGFEVFRDSCQHRFFHGRRSEGSLPLNHERVSHSVYVNNPNIHFSKSLDLGTGQNMPEGCCHNHSFPPAQTILNSRMSKSTSESSCCCHRLVAEFPPSQNIHESSCCNHRLANELHLTEGSLENSSCTHNLSKEVPPPLPPKQSSKVHVGHLRLANLQNMTGSAGRNVAGKNLIDDSPVEERLLYKYGKIWDGLEIEKNQTEAIRVANQVFGDSTAPTDDISIQDLELFSTSCPESVLITTADHAEHLDKVGSPIPKHATLLEALLSPSGSMDRLSRLSNNSSPVPPPRRKSKRYRDNRRKTFDASNLQKCVIIDLTTGKQGCMPYDSAEGRESVIAKRKANVPSKPDPEAPPIPPRVEKELGSQQDESNKHQCSDVTEEKWVSPSLSTEQSEPCYSSTGAKSEEESLNSNLSTEDTGKQGQLGTGQEKTPRSALSMELLKSCYTQEAHISGVSKEEITIQNSTSNEIVDDQPKACGVNIDDSLRPSEFDEPHCSQTEISNSSTPANPEVQSFKILERNDECDEKIPKPEPSKANRDAASTESLPSDELKNEVQKKENEKRTKSLSKQKSYHGGDISIPDDDQQKTSVGNSTFYSSFDSTSSKETSDEDENELSRYIVRFESPV